MLGFKIRYPKMIQPAALQSLGLFSLIFSFLLTSVGSSNLYVNCSPIHFTLTTPYELNLESIFTSLVNSASLSNFNTFQFPPREFSQSDVVYGLFQCQGDLSLPNCRDCVASSVSNLKEKCRVSIGAIIQSKGCFVKYDNTSFFGFEDKTEMLKSCGPSVDYDNMDVLNGISDTLKNLIATNGQYFRQVWTGTIQGVAQCIHDLSLSDCQDCLVDAGGRLRSECPTSSWGDMYLDKCYIRYADKGIDPYTDNQPPVPTKREKKKKRNDGSAKKDYIWDIIGVIIFAALGFIAAEPTTFPNSTRVVI